MQTLLTYTSKDQAADATATLVNNGYPAVAHDEAGVQVMFLASSPLASMKVEVDDAHYLEARRYVRERVKQNDPVFVAAWHCPECGDSDVEYPQFSRRTVIPTLMMDLLAMGKLLERKCYCLSCHATWKPEETANVATPAPEGPAAEDLRDVAL